MTAKLHVRLLGGFELIYRGARVTAIEKSPRLQSLLAYLLLNASRPQTRRQIAFTFWPDSPESQARTNLRKVIYQLQKGLPGADHYLHIEDHALQWNTASSYELDVDQLEIALATTGEDPSDKEAIGAIIRFYQGTLLPGFDEDWLSERRVTLQRRVVQAMTDQAAYCERRGSFDQATAIVQRLLSLEPYEEGFYQQLMRLRALASDRTGALRAYQAARTMLHDEFGVPPASRTELLYERIVSGEILSGGGENQRNAEPAIPLIGRESDWETAQAICTSLQTGDSQCLWISGEAGIGKTRFAEELLARAYLAGYVVARTRSYAAHGDLAYAPVAELLRRPELAQRIATLDDVWLSELALILPELLIERPDLAQASPLSGSGLRLRFYEALCNVVLAAKQPVLLLFDDLQWCDEETFAWLHYLLRREHDSQLLVVGTYRDDEVNQDHPLRALANSLYREGQLVDINLLPLGQEATAHLAEAVDKKRLGEAARHELFASTHGNPLFVIELTRARRDHGNAQPRRRVAPARIGAFAELPPKIYGLIQYRLGRLSAAAQEVLEVAAVIGRSFEHPLLLAASRVADETVTDALAELSDKRVTREQRAGVYDFTHDKLRDVVLATMRDTHRRLLSRNVAEAYEAIYRGRIDDVVGELAVAYEGAGQYEEAVSYYHQAAQAEIRRGAYKRAETYLETALALIADAGEPRALATVELTLQLSRANVARVIQRNTVPKARDAFARALELSEAMGDEAGRFQALFGLAEYHMTDAELAQASNFCEQSITVAQAIGDEASLVRAHLQFGFISLIRGEFRAAKEHLELVCSRDGGGRAEPLTTLQGQDTGVMAHIYLSVVLWYLGYSEQADESMARAETLAEQLGLPINLAFVCFYQMLMSQIKHDIPAARRYADRLVHMSEQYDIGFTLIAGRACQAYVAAAQEPGNRRLVEAFEEHMTLYHEQVSGLSRPLYLSLRARLYLEAERYEEATAVLRKAAELIDALDDRYSAAEVYRLQGELLAASGQGHPEMFYLRAIAVATEQEAKLLQLRATNDLCRLWQGQGKQEEAQRLLVDLYDWFSEGWATSELQAARVLLDELAPSQGANMTGGRATPPGRMNG